MHEIAIKDRKVGQLADLDGATLVLVAHQPGRIIRIHAKGLLSADCEAWVSFSRVRYGAPVDLKAKRQHRVVRGYAGRVRTTGDGEAGVKCQFGGRNQLR